MTTKWGALCAVLTGAAMFVACDGTTQSDTEVTSDALSNTAGSIQPAGLRLGPPPGGDIDPLLREGTACDATPTKTTQDVCGKTFPSETHLDWTACELRPPMGPGGRGGGDCPGMDGGFGQRPPPPPQDSTTAENGVPPAGASGPSDGQAPFGIPPQDGAKPTSDGNVDVVEKVTLLSGTACEADAVYQFDRTSTFKAARTGPGGGSMNEQGTVTSTSQHALDATSFISTDTVDVTHSGTGPDGVAHNVHLTGTLTTSVDLSSGGAPTLKQSGTLTEDADGSAATVELTDVVRTPPEQCPFPTGGTLKRTAADGTSHTLVYGPDCGKATLDGAAIDLKAAGHGGPGGPGGPDGRGGPRP